MPSNPALVALAAALAFAAQAEESVARQGVNVSWGDHIVIFRKTARLDTPEKIRAAMPLWKRHLGGRHLFWRVSGITLERDFVRAS